MKDMKKYLMGLLVVAVMATVTACSFGLDELPEEKVETKEEVGYLQLSNFKVVSDTENKNNDDEIEPGTGNSTTSKHTRAGETTSQVDFSNYYIEIVNKNPRENEEAIVWKGIYKDNVSSTTDFGSGNGVMKKIPLEPGSYQVWAYQDQTKGNKLTVAKDAPYYAGYSDVEIVSEQTSDVTVICRLHNIRVTVELSNDLKDMFWVCNEVDNTDRLMTEVSIGTTEVNKNTHIFESSTSHDAPWMYYKDVAGGYGNTMDIKLTGVFYTGPVEDIYTGAAAQNTDKWKPVKMEKKVSGGAADKAVTGGQWRQISIDIEHNDEGNAQFIFTIDSYVYDETITVSTMTLYQNLPADKNFTQEEQIPEDDFNDEMAPQVKVDGATFDTENNAFNYSISADMIDSDASTDSFNAWTSFLKVKVAVPSGSTATVNNVYVEFKESTSTSLLQALEKAGFEDHIIALHPSADENISQYVNVATDGSSFTLNNKGMDAIYNYEGTHKIRVHTEGSDGRRGFADVVITVSQAASTGPKVIWKVDGRSSSEVTISKGSLPNSVDAEISSSTGITGLTVKIESEDLDETTLSGFGLSTEMDIFNPTSAKMETRLRAFGFLPIENFDRKGKSENEIAAVAANDDNYRMFDVTDEAGEEGTLKDGATSVYLNEKSINFSITDFMGALSGFAGDHTFTITATDASGSNTKALTITVE